MKLSLALAVATAGFTSVASSQTERDLDSHEHGAASLNVAIDDGSLFLELESPWNNLIGFEHEPRTDEQHALFDEATAKLNQPDLLFALNGGGCSVSEMTLENMGAVAGHDDHEDGHDDHDEDHEDGHKDEHDDHDEDAHGDDHDDHDHDEETHSAVLVSYVYECSDMSSLESIDVVLLNVWSGFEDLDVQLIGPGGQASVELGQQQTSLDVTQVQ